MMPLFVQHNFCQVFTKRLANIIVFVFKFFVNHRLPMSVRICFISVTIELCEPWIPHSAHLPQSPEMPHPCSHGNQTIGFYSVRLNYPMSVGDCVQPLRRVVDVFPSCCIAINLKTGLPMQYFSSYVPFFLTG